MKKIVLTLLSIITTVYSITYASLGGFIGNEGALSKIGLTHPILFSAWGILTCAALFSNIAYAFSKTKYKFYIYLLVIAGIGMILTLCFDFDYSKLTEYRLHCIGSLTFSVIMGITVFLLFLLKKDYILTAVSASILVTDLILLIVYQETALIELAPIIAGYIMLAIHNLRQERETIEAVR